MRYAEYRFLILSDLYRVAGKVTMGAFLRHAFFGEAYRYLFWMRTCRYTKSRSFLRYAAFPVAWFLLRRLRYRFGLSIPYQTEIGAGFYVGHFGGIVISDKCIIGRDCNISQGVTLGKANRGAYKGFPVLGDRVYVGPGAKIVGSVKIGDDVAIGANCVVTKDIPNSSVVVGVPGRVISSSGSVGYINKTDYQCLESRG